MSIDPTSDARSVTAPSAEESTGSVYRRRTKRAPSIHRLVRGLLRFRPRLQLRRFFLQLYPSPPLPDRRDDRKEGDPEPEHRTAREDRDPALQRRLPRVERLADVEERRARCAAHRLVERVSARDAQEDDARYRRAVALEEVLHERARQRVSVLHLPPVPPEQVVQLPERHPRARQQPQRQLGLVA